MPHSTAQAVTQVVEHVMERERHSKSTSDHNNVSLSRTSSTAKTQINVPKKDVTDNIELTAYETDAAQAITSDSGSVRAHSASVITPSMRQKARIQFASLCYCLFLAGWNDGSTGPLLPRIQKVYNIGFAVVSLLFIMNCIGFVSGAALNVLLTDRLGFGKVLVIGSLSQTIAYTIISPAPPFPVMCLAYVFNGFGIALQDAQANGYVACLKENASAKMGLLHAVYGLGALSAPLVATQFVQLPRWSFHYLVSLGIAVTNTVLLLIVFRGKSQDECLQDVGHAVPESNESNDSKYRQIMRQRVVHLLAFFGLVYVGVEVTIGGWTVTYIINQRGGGASSGYVSAGFFGGLTLGRVALLWINAKIGERRVIFIYGLLAIGLEVTIWVVPSLIGNAVAVSIVGVLLGPMYPILMNESAKLIPPWLLTGAIGWIAGIGQAGSAILPFLTGALASRYGIRSLQPFLIVLMSIMMVVWALVPRSQRRND